MNDAVPPPIPAPAMPHVKPAPQKIKGITGAEGITTAELSDLVARGARLVIFQYCISVLVLSFKRSSGIYIIKPGEGAIGKALPFCLISLVAGWWGIPWGPIWTIMTISTNLGGGKDVTQPVLARMGMAMPVPR